MVLSSVHPLVGLGVIALIGLVALVVTFVCEGDL